jgi:hypothetical protein
VKEKKQVLSGKGEFASILFILRLTSNDFARSTGEGLEINLPIGKDVVVLDVFVLDVFVLDVFVLDVFVLDVFVLDVDVLVNTIPKIKPKSTTDTIEKFRSFHTSNKPKINVKSENIKAVCGLDPNASIKRVQEIIA